MLGIILLLLPFNDIISTFSYKKENPFEEHISVCVYLCLGILPIFILIQFIPGSALIYPSQYPYISIIPTE